MGPVQELLGRDPDGPDVFTGHRNAGLSGHSIVRYITCWYSTVASNKFPPGYPNKGRLKPPHEVVVETKIVQLIQLP